MATIKNSTIGDNQLFNLNGLDYEKGIYCIFYNYNDFQDGDNVSAQGLRLGIRSKYDHSVVIQSPVSFDQYTDGVTNYSSWDDLIEDLANVLDAQGSVLSADVL